MEAMSRWSIVGVGIAGLLTTCCWVLLGAAIHACATTPPAAKAMPCLTKPPPEQRAFLPTNGGDLGCPRAFMWCLDTESGVRLSGNQREFREWMADAWERCGP